MLEQRPTKDTKWGVILAAFIFIVLMYRLPVDIMRQGFDASFQINAVLLLAAFVAVKVNFHAGVLLAWVVAGSFLSALFYSDFKILCTDQSFAAIRGVSSGVIIYSIIVLTKPDEKWLFYVFCAALMLHLMCQIVQVLNGRPSIGIMFNPNGAGTFAVLCSIPFFRPKWAWLLFIPILSVVCARSCGGAIGFSCAAIAAGFIYLRSWQKLIPLMAVIIGCGLYVWLIDKPSLNRIEAWAFITNWAFDNKWFIGVGPGNWKIFFNKLYGAGYFTDMSWVRVHNTWLEGFVEMGVLFVALVVAFLFDVFRRFRKEAALSLIALTAIIGVGMSNSFFKFNQLNGMVAIIWLAILERRLMPCR